MKLSAKTGFLIIFLSLALICACAGGKEKDTAPEVQESGASEKIGRGEETVSGSENEVKNVLPVVNITCESKYDSGSLYTYQKAAISFDGISYNGEEMKDVSLDTQLKYRGNSTLNRPKKSFRLKLDKKQDLFGMGKSKHWVLLANDIDHTQMRNILLNQFAYDIGSEVKIDSVSVDLYFNGEYEGVYQLCEHVRLGENRVDITDWEEIAKEAAKTIAKVEMLNEDAQDELEEALSQSFSWTDAPYEISFRGKNYCIADYVTIPEPTGGFLLEMDFYAYEDSSLAKLVSAYRLPLYFNTPEVSRVGYFKNTGLYQYAQKYMQSFEYSLHSDDFVFHNGDVHYKVTNPGRYSWSRGKWVDTRFQEADYEDVENDGKHYSQFFDMDSLVNNFVFCEYAMNWDSMKNSFFAYKDVGKLAKIGPQWDFDWCWGNRNMYGIDTNYPTEWHTTMDYFTNEQFYQTQQYNRMLIHDPYFLARVFEKYHEIRPTVIEKMVRDGGRIDQYADYLKESAKKNDDRWKSTYRAYGGQTFTLAVNQMKSFITKRVAWLDEQFAELDTLVDSLGGYRRSELLKMEGATNEKDGSITVTATVSDKENGGEAVARIRFVLNGTLFREAVLEGGRATVTFSGEELDAEHGNIIVAMELNTDGKYIYDEEFSAEGDYHIVEGSYLYFPN